MQSEKMCVVLLFGGMSSEHEVSRVSVGNFVHNIDREKYEAVSYTHLVWPLQCRLMPTSRRSPLPDGRVTAA